MLTVGELKALFAGVPNDTPIVMSGYYGEWLEIDSFASVERVRPNSVKNLDAQVPGPFVVVIPTVDPGEEPD